MPVAAPDDTLLDLNEKLWDTDWGEIPVVDPATPGRGVGVGTRRALHGAVGPGLLQRHRRRTRGAGPEGSVGASDYLELPRGHRVEVVAVPAWPAGRTLDLSAVRQPFRVTAVAVRRGEPGAIAWLDPDDAGVLRVDDRLAVVGAPAHIERFRASVSNPS